MAKLYATVEKTKLTSLFVAVRIRGLLQKIDIDRAVFFGLLERLWGMGSGPVTAILMATRFTPELQGYYYTFATLLALQVFVELGLGTVIVQFASHEWAKLTLDNSGHIVGEPDSLSRLRSIANIAFKWYAIAAIIVVVSLMIGGYFFFSKSNVSQINWLSPWLLLCVMSGISICLVPVWSLLEGCNQVGKLYTFRFFQSVLSSISIWVAILLGAGLWVTSFTAIATFVLSIIFLRSRYWVFLKTLIIKKAKGPKIDWRKDMLPMQWKIAVGWMCGYFLYSFFVPVLFKYQGPVIAGQMGMTWGIVGLMGGLAGSWLNPRAPQFGMLIAGKKYEELDRLLWRTVKVVIGVAASLGFMLWFFVFLINLSSNIKIHNLAARILPPLPTGLFLLAQVISISASPLSTYLRAHKKEPFLFVSIFYSMLLACSTYFLGKNYSAIGMAWGYLLINIILLPINYFIWYNCRKKWHEDEVV